MNERNILVVDDEAPIRDMIEAAFLRVGYSIFSAINGEQALEILNHESIPLMFLDLGLETITGFELCERIRKDHAEAIIYALTGYAGLFDPNEFLVAGFDDCLCKPISIQVLYEVARNSFAELDRRAELPPKKAVERILIIDDDDQFRKMLRWNLEHAGYEVMEACDGRQGIERFSEMPADLVITDIVMPVKEGVETILEIKEAHPEVKFIAVSGGGWQAFEIDFEMARTLGARTLKKPFQRDEILEMIEDFKN
jgi:DNA-binding response OmpR family regulator